MPAVRNDPLEIAAAMSSIRWWVWASAFTSAILSVVPQANVISAVFDITRCVSTPALRRSCSSRTPYKTPDAPEIPTIRRRGTESRDFICTPVLLQRTERGRGVAVDQTRRLTKSEQIIDFYPIHHR